MSGRDKFHLHVTRRPKASAGRCNITCLIGDLSAKSWLRRALSTKRRCKSHPRPPGNSCLKPRQKPHLLNERDPRANVLSPREKRAFVDGRML